MSNLLMESIVTLVAEWLSQGEMIKLQGISVLMSVNFKEWQYVDFVDEDDKPGVGVHDRRVGRVHVR